MRLGPHNGPAKARHPAFAVMAAIAQTTRSSYDTNYEGNPWHAA